MTTRQRHGQGGQILVLFAGGLLALLAIGALVIDVGSIVMTRRHEQNAADPGALAAARYIQATGSTPAGDTTSMWTAACFYARENGFFPNATDCRNDATGDVLAVNYPPSAGAGQFAGHPGYVEVVISQPHDSVLAGVLGITKFTVATGAVAAFDTGSAGSSSLIALNPTACASGSGSGSTIGGTGRVYIHPASGVTAPGGYVQVDSSCGQGSPDGICSTAGSTKGALNIQGSSTLQAPDVYIVGTCFGGGTVQTSSGTTTEGANYVGDPMSSLRIPQVNPPGQACPDKTGVLGPATTPTGAEGCKFNSSNTFTLTPGVYYGGWSIGSPNVSIILQPGIYVLAGGGIKQTGGSLSSAGGRVLIISTDDPQYTAACKSGGSTPPNACQGPLNLGGASTLTLTGLDGSPCPPVSSTGCPYAGMLIWQDGAGSNPQAAVTLEGSTSLNLSGTIYAPGANVTITGNSSTTGCGGTGDINCAAIQIVSDTFTIIGGGVLDMPYDPSKFYQLDMKGLVR